MNFVIATAKLLVVTGYPYENGIHSEVIDLEHEDLTCQELANAPYQMDDGTGGFVQNDVMICGGYDGNDHPPDYPILNKCWILGQNKSISMEYERDRPSGTVINDRVSHTMSELALILHKIPKSFDHSELLFKHWTKLFPKN